MNILRATSIALELMQEHGLFNHPEWEFAYDSATRRAGCCFYGKRKITLSHHFVKLNDEAKVRDTILHEIAHALAGYRAAHGPVWKQMCCQIGAEPRRCFDSTKVEMPKGKYGATCPGCKKDFSKHRAVTRKYFCRKCGPEKGKLDFRKSSF